MSRRHSDSKRRHSRFDPQPSGKRYRREQNGDHRRLNENDPPSAKQQSASLHNKPNDHHAPHPTQQEKRGSTGQVCQSSGQRKASERGWWKDSSKQLNERAETSHRREQRDDKSQAKPDDNTFQRRDGFSERKDDPPSTSRKRPAFREKRIPMESGDANLAAAVAVKSSEIDHPSGRNDRKKEERSSNPHHLDRPEKPFADDRAPNKVGARRDGFPSRGRRYGGSDSYRGRDQFNGRQGYRLDKIQTEKWKHDLYQIRDNNINSNSDSDSDLLLKQVKSLVLQDMAADTEPKKIIIDTDPGIDDAMAIFVALQSPEIEVIGLTTIYGNVYTTLATRNALHLLEVAGRTDIPVAEGTHLTLTKGTKLRIADFVHGADGLGNQNFPPPKGKPIEESAASFLVRQAKLNPGKVTVVALGPLTNIALAIELDPEFVKNIGQIVILGGAFAVNGNVNPAAEANIFGDPDAADVVFTSGADILAVGINVTHQVILTSSDREILASSNGKFAQYLHKILDVYFSYHQESYNTKGVYLHDPTVVLAAVDPSLVTCIEGIVRVQTSGITRGLTLLYNKQKRFGEIHEWSNKPTVKVAVTVDAPRVMKLVMDRLLDS